jgi:hypothetical protein
MSDGADRAGGALIFVDEIEEGDAYLVLGERRFAVPRSLLPAGVKEGTWLRLVPVDDPALAGEIEARRERLRGTDPGGDIKL